jgi:hypothetical protein
MTTDMPKTYGELADAGAPMCAAWSLMMDLHVALKAQPIKDRVWRYAWTHDGAPWSLLVNGTPATVEHTPYLEMMVCRDWLPMLLCGPFNGLVMGGSEDQVILAMTHALAEVRG